ncbi:hypothetical protein GOP47_0021292 [Adiantum capillus-veneris]|uniref:FHA domain-containing protein n=1 Tax=Adiantum capillus-veneris TaxID=13818 RepID=A0A9D4UB90_ADICA|nr:hypothetical protein GOP47_0021292 [Adiantum capillus-veneris]
MQALSMSYAPVAAFVVQPASHGCGSSPDGVSTSTLALARPSALRLRRTLPSSKQLNPINAVSYRSACTLHVFAADASIKTERWVLQPIGDGDCNHLDEAVPLPGAIELAADAATVGRVPEKADIVIPIATVSGLHARLERKGATLFVTDLDSTNGTYINDRQIRPGAVTPVPPGSRVTFGDDHLAAFKFAKVEESTA